MFFKTWTEAEEDPIVNFGIHRNKSLSEIPDDYLHWMLSSNFKFTPSNKHLRDAVQKELEKRKKPDDLRQFGIKLLGGQQQKTLNDLQIQQIANEISKTGKKPFAREQFYSEAVLPEAGNPGWIAFNFYNNAGVISIWEYGKNFTGHDKLNAFLKSVVDNKYENKDQEIEDFLFSYNKPDSRDFDQARIERRTLRDQWEKDHRKVIEFIDGALQFWHSKLPLEIPSNPS